LKSKIPRHAGLEKKKKRRWRSLFIIDSARLSLKGGHEEKT